uniref:Uncharacterized protein n=1 Tax=Hyaloperonospora arabidopsidis (strain Emoy2) TaxID=559515 RepID=M4BU22_HYAAE
MGELEGRRNRWRRRNEDQRRDACWLRSTGYLFQAKLPKAHHVNALPEPKLATCIGWDMLQRLNCNAILVAAFWGTGARSC